MGNVVKTPQLAGPRPVAELPRRVGRSTISRGIDRYLFEARLKIRALAVHKTKRVEHEAKRFQSLLAWRATGPVPKFHRIGPPPRAITLRSPGDTVVTRRSRTGDGIGRSDKIREATLEFVAVVQINPSSLPQASHASVIRSIRPRSSGWTGSIPVIALRAQNQCSGSFSSSINNRGTAWGPRPIIC